MNQIKNFYDYYPTPRHAYFICFVIKLNEDLKKKLNEPSTRMSAAHISCCHHHRLIDEEQLNSIS